MCSVEFVSDIVGEFALRMSEPMMQEREAFFGVCVRVSGGVGVWVTGIQFKIPNTDIRI